MIYQKHIVPDLFEIGNIFDNMAAGTYKYHQFVKGELSEKVPSVNYQKWEKVDDRFDSLFGSTYKVPLEPLPTNDSEFKITIHGDRWLCDKTTTTTARILDKWELSQVYSSTIDQTVQNTLIDELPIMFPNATINIIGDVGGTSGYRSSLEDVLSYLQSLTEYPDYFIFNGVEKSFENSGSASYCVNLLDQINEIVYNNDIEAYVIFTPLPSTLLVGELEYLTIMADFNGEYIKQFRLNEWMLKHTYIYEDYVQYGKTRDNLTTPPVTDSQKLDYNSFVWYVNGNLKYKEVIYNTIKNAIYNDLFGEVLEKQKCFYISLAHKDIHSYTYGYYHGPLAGVFEADNFPEQMITEIPIYPHPKYNFRGKFFDRNTPWNLFDGTGELIAIGLHKEYSHDAWLCEQIGSTCFDEGSKIRQDTRGVVSELGGLMPILRERYASEYRMSPPLFQNTGTSWLTISDSNKERYANKVGFACPIEVYISRDDYNFTITTRIHTEKGYQDLYQSVAAGKMSNSTYTRPLYVCGGTTGMKNDVWSYIPIAGPRTEIHGSVYNLDMDNISLSNTTANHPTKFLGAIFSNFKIYNSQVGVGYWRSIFLHRQEATVIREYNSCGVPQDHVTWLNEPIYAVGRLDGIAFPCSSDNRNRIDSDWLKGRGYTKTQGREPLFTEPKWFDSPLQSFRGFTKASWYDNNSFYCSGNIETIFSSWGWEVPNGEMSYAGKKYLVIPCGWDERLYWYEGRYVPKGYGTFNHIWENDVVIEEYEKSKLEFNRRQIKDKLFVLLEG